MGTERDDVVNILWVICPLKIETYLIALQIHAFALYTYLYGVVTKRYVNGRYHHPRMAGRIVAA